MYSKGAEDMAQKATVARTGDGRKEWYGKREGQGKPKTDTPKPRFEFILTNNGNIVCQRLFNVFGFRPQALSSLELIDAFDYAVTLIQNDLKSKSRIYLALTAPQVFENEDEKDEWLARHPDGLESHSYVAIRDTRKVYFYDGEELKDYDKYFNTGDFMDDPEQEQLPCKLKFSLIDHGMKNDENRVVLSREWDGCVYPRFVRTNIDLSNSKNKYSDYKSESFSPGEALLVNAFNAGKEDLIPIITNEFHTACSCDRETKKGTFTKAIEYGDTKYHLCVEFENQLYEEGYLRWWNYRNRNTDDR